jgi:hypothetical protein
MIISITANDTVTDTANDDLRSLLKIGDPNAYVLTSLMVELKSTGIYQKNLYDNAYNSYDVY